ncbi:MAG: Methyl-accepting chemotaxis protein [Blastococcus sp.]|nr:Methyl-accepting chemotaxis protein [Blastococcus sp.]
MAVAAVVAALVGILGLQALSRSAGTTHAMREVNIHSLTATADMRFALSDLRIAARSAALAPAREKTQEYLDGIPEITKRFENAARSYKAGGVTAGQGPLVDEAAAAYADYIRLMGTTLGPLALAKDTPATSLRATPLPCRSSRPPRRT